MARIDDEIGKSLACQVLDMRIAQDGMTIGELIAKYRAGMLREIVTCGECQRGTLETEGVIAGYINCDWCGYGELHPPGWHCADGIRKPNHQRIFEAMNNPPESERKE